MQTDMKIDNEGEMLAARVMIDVLNKAVDDKGLCPFETLARFLELLQIHIDLQFVIDVSERLEKAETSVTKEQEVYLAELEAHKAEKHWGILIVESKMNNEFKPKFSEL